MGFDGLDMETRMFQVRQRLKAACVSKSGYDWQRLFRQMDRNGDGALNLDELRQGIRRDLRLSDRTVTDKDVKYLFNMIDEDHSGEISFQEFFGYIRKGDQKSEEMKAQKKARRLAETRRAIMIAVGKSGYFNAGRLRELFKSHDDDYSGTLDYGEFQFFLREATGSKTWDFSDQDVRHLFESIDADKSGGVDAEEFLDFVFKGSIGGAEISLPTLEKVNPRPKVPGIERPTGKRTTEEYRWANWLQKSTPSLSHAFSCSTRGMAPRGRMAMGRVSPANSGWITQDIHDWDPDRPVYRFSGGLTINDSAP
jgi:Ca2+-binding EF-hand superfamily protein